MALNIQGKRQKTKAGRWPPPYKTCWFSLAAIFLLTNWKGILTLVALVTKLFMNVSMYGAISGNLQFGDRLNFLPICKVSVTENINFTSFINWGQFDNKFWDGLWKEKCSNFKGCKLMIYDTQTRALVTSHTSWCGCHYPPINTVLNMYWARLFVFKSCHDIALGRFSSCLPQYGVSGHWLRNSLLLSRIWQ